MNLNFNLNFNKYYNFSYKLLVLSGLHLGGNIQNFDLSNSSVIYGIRTANVIINLILTSLEMIKSFKVFEASGLNRQTVYYINSSFGSRTSVKDIYQSFNIHLGTHFYKKDSDHFKKIKYSKLENSMFYLSNWPNGFLSNRRSFCKYFTKVYRCTVLQLFYKKNYFFDWLPRRASSGVLTNTNLNIKKEFMYYGIPCLTLGDVFYAKTQSDLIGTYNLPSNSCSYEVSSFYISICLAAYIYGYYKLVIQFFPDSSIFKLEQTRIKYDKFLLHKKRRPHWDASWL